MKIVLICYNEYGGQIIDYNALSLATNTTSLSFYFYKSNKHFSAMFLLENKCFPHCLQIIKYKLKETQHPKKAYYKFSIQLFTNLRTSSTPWRDTRDLLKHVGKEDKEYMDHLIHIENVPLTENGPLNAQYSTVKMRVMSNEWRQEKIPIR